MSLRLLIGHEEGDDSPTGERVVMFDSTTMWAFGPVFDGTENLSAHEEATMFLRWSDEDRGIDDLRSLDANAIEALYGEWVEG